MSRSNSTGIAIIVKYTHGFLPACSRRFGAAYARSFVFVIPGCHVSAGVVWPFMLLYFTCQLKTKFLFFDKSCIYK